MRIINVSHDQIQAVLAHIQRGIDAGANGTAVETTAQGIFTHIIIDLDLGIKVIPE